MTRNRADLRVRERFEQARKGIALAMRVGIDENDQTMPRTRESALQRPGFSFVFLLQGPDPRIQRSHPLNFGRGSILRTVVDDNDFDRPGVVRIEQRLQGAADDLRFVIGGNHHADRLRKISPRPAPKTIGQPDHDQRAQNHQSRRDDHKGPEKFFDRMIDAETGRANEARQ